ncbi:MAG: sortase [Coriobacteriia bacterium]
MVGTVGWRRMLSNVLLGMALGLLSYYALTSALAWTSQNELRRQTPDIPAFQTRDPAESMDEPADAPVMDFEGWEERDLAFWHGVGEGDTFGRLVIPAIGVDTLVLASSMSADLRKGPGWIEWTELPGPSGTCGIAGHRTTYGAPFRRLGELGPGDTIDLFSPYRRYRYEVVRALVVTPDRIEVVANVEHPMLVLTACHPPYSARYRLAVQAELIEVRRTRD